MGEGKRNLFQSILDIAEDIGNESASQEQFYGNVKEKARYFHKNVSGIYDELQYWADSERVQEDEKQLAEIMEYSEILLRRYKIKRMIILVITIIMLFFV